MIPPNNLDSPAEPHNIGFVRSILAEIRRRRVPATIVWYAIGAWAVIQVADVVGPALAFPPQTVRYLVFAAAAGLPLIVAAAWFFDIKPADTKPQQLTNRNLAEGMPRNAEAYELYVRANHISTRSGEWQKAIDVYRECLERDPNYAPAWARIARCYRLLGKFSETPQASEKYLTEARQAFERSLQLNPDLPLTHSLYAQLEMDLGRPEEAMIRLLARVAIGAADAEIFAGLVQACRFLGLLDESLAAYQRARELDPNVRTGVAHTYFQLGRYDEAISEYRNADIGYLEGLALVMLGRADEALALLRVREQKGTLVGPYIGSLRALLEGDRDEAVRLIGDSTTTSLARDGEAVYYMAREYAYLGEHALALEFLQSSIQQGFVCYPAMMRDPWMDPLRANHTFKGLMQAAETRHRQAVEAFVAANGRPCLKLKES